MSSQSVAIIGGACRVPGGDSTDALWSIASRGLDVVTRASTNVGATSSERVHAYGLLRDVGMFDSEFFQYSPREADLIDPQQRLLLECAVEALESGSVRVEHLGHAIGVFAATGLPGYLLTNRQPGPAGTDDLSSLIGSDGHYAATRIAYKLDLSGPAMAVGSACSSSLLAIHLAAQSITAGECDLALAGGMDVEFPQPTSYLYQEGGILSKRGVCRPFDAAADGTVFGSGGGLVLLADLDIAKERGWPIRAVLAGSAVNNDGAEKASFTAPRASRQAAVMRQALAVADLEPSLVTYVECHGTGTNLGDRSELNALREVFGDRLPVLGSAKANFGHLRVGAGVVGFLKACEVVRHRTLPPLANVEAPLDDDLHASLPRDLQTLDVPSSNVVAGVSSFGFGGTNVHAVVRGFDQADTSEQGAGDWPSVLRVSSAGPDSCLSSAMRVAELLREDGGAPVADIARTLAEGRDDRAYRLAVVGTEREHLSKCLDGATPGAVEGWARPDSAVVLLLPGQGTDLRGQARDLRAVEPDFAASLQTLWDESVQAGSGLGDLDQALNDPDVHASSGTGQVLHVAILLAVTGRLRTRGVSIAAVAGYSLGEYAAAAIAGVLRPVDALTLVAERAKLLASAPAGAMIAVRTDADLLARLLPGVEIAATLASDRFVLSVASADVATTRGVLDEAGIGHLQLDVNLPYHSSLLSDIAATFRPLEGQVTRQRPREADPTLLPLVKGAAEIHDSYWSAHMSTPLDLSPIQAAVQQYQSKAGALIVDLSTDGFLARCAQSPGVPVVLPFRSSSNVAETYVQAIAELWCNGQQVDTQPAGAAAGHLRSLHTRTFDRTNHLLEAAEVRTQPSVTKAVRREKSLDQWMYHTSWAETRLSPTERAIAGERWLVLGDGPIGAALAEQLTSRSVDVEFVSPEGRPRQEESSDTGRQVKAGDRPSISDLVGNLQLGERPLQRVVHAWCLDAPNRSEADLGSRLDGLSHEYERGFFTLLHLVQEIAKAQGARPIELDIVATGMHPLPGDRNDICPDRALLAGPGLVIPQDFPAMSVRTLDVTGAARDAQSDEELAATIVTELSSASMEPTVSLGKGSRWLRCYRRDVLLPVPEGQLPSRLRKHGVYLITGGLGGIGMTLAEYLVQTCGARLVLTGMEAVPDNRLWEADSNEVVTDAALADRVARIRRLVELGGEVMAVRCDAADPSQTAELFTMIEQRFGALHGVVHAAGVFETQRAFRGLDDTNREDCMRRLRPKVEGTLVLAEQLKGRKLDFVLMQSSLSSHLGGLGFYAYTAGNAFMDAFAERFRSTDIPWMTVNWDGWIFRERGEDTQSQSVVSPSFASPDFGVVAEIAIRPSEGQEIYARLMNMKDPHQILVSTADFEQRIAQWVHRSPAADSSSPAHRVMRGAVGAEAGPELSEHGLVKAVAALWSEVLGVSEVTDSSNFFSLGGDSLLGVSVAHRLSVEFGVVLSVITMFDNPTVLETAAEIGRLRSLLHQGVVS